MTTAELNVHKPTIVNTHPLEMAAIHGAPAMAATHESIFLQKLFTATPDELLLGMNSVNIVVVMAKISMLPTP